METNNQPKLGTWENMSTEETERHPKLEFEINKPIKVELINEPQEYQGESGAYYIFPVIEQGEEKVIMTSAWTLLKGLKKLSPLPGKKAEIVKVMNQGKQQFEVKEVKD